MLNTFQDYSSKSFKIRFHLLFIFLLSLNYFFPLILFGDITLFYHDALDSEIVYNHILGKIYRGDLTANLSFINGELNLEYMRRLFQPYSLLYGIFNTEAAYWIADILVKLTSYFSFFLLAKKINKNIFLCCLISALFASINIPTHEGFGIAIFPYLIYLMLFKQNLKLKNYILIIFFGLNSDIIRVILALPFILLIIYLIDKKILIEKFLNIFIILLIFSLSVLISNSNMIYAQLFSGPFHRLEFLRESMPLLDNFTFHILSDFFRIPNLKIDWTFIKEISFTIFVFPMIIWTLVSKNDIAKKFLILIFATHIVQFLLVTKVTVDFTNNLDGFLKTFNFSYIKTILPILYVLLLLFLTQKKERFLNYLIFPIIFSLIFFQINSSLVPFAKQYFVKNEIPYKNLYTFNGYYSYKAYGEIKNEVKKDRVISIGLDPLVAVMNDINVIDGYHPLYPLSYKHKFRTIIQNQLETNKKYKKYYDNWGNRLYSSLYDIHDPNRLVDYKTAKNVGAQYVISKYELISEDLILKCIKCKNDLYLYKIN